MMDGPSRAKTHQQFHFGSGFPTDRGFTDRHRLQTEHPLYRNPAELGRFIENHA
jgi:hypothetical protein